MVKGVIQKSACILLQKSLLLVRSVGNSTCLEDERKLITCTGSLELVCYRD